MIFVAGRRGGPSGVSDEDDDDDVVFTAQFVPMWCRSNKSVYDLCTHCYDDGIDICTALNTPPGRLGVGFNHYGS